VLPTVPPPPPDAFTNGSFESGYTGWLASGNQQLSPRASQGIVAVQFNPGQTEPNGLLSQTFATIPGQTYALAFDVGTDWGTPNTPQSLEVTVSGNNTLLSETLTVYGTGNSSSAYLSTNYTFAADSTSTTLAFEDVSDTGLNIDLLLDNVQVNPVSIILALRPPGAAAQVALALAVSDSNVLLSCQGPTGQQCDIQVSSDLADWRTLTTVQTTVEMTLVARQSIAKAAHLFYRVVLGSGGSKATKE
jgi:hypothetical protein